MKSFSKQGKFLVFFLTILLLVLTLGSINSLADESSEQTPPVSDTETAEGTSGEDFAEITPYVDGSGSFGTVSWDITGNTLTLYGGSTDF